jgi:putative flippase GtrA
MTLDVDLGMLHALRQRFLADPALARRFMTFLAVGGFSAVAYVATMAVVVDLIGASAVAGAIAAFLIGTVLSYAGNTWLSFGAAPNAGNAARFLVVVLVGLGLNWLMAWTMERMGFHHLAIALIILTTVPIINFVGHEFWTFGRRSRPS